MPTNVSLLPITLGVTGHRDVQDAALLLALLQNEVAAIEARYPHSPILGLSSLAEGADRLFASVMMEKGLPLHVVLPFAQAEYEKDFATAESVTAFRTLCDYAAQTGGIYCVETVIPGSEAMIAHADQPQDAVYRDLQYARAGMYLAQRCHILFALWDGQPARGLGGTAQVVNFRREGRIQQQDLQQLTHTLPGIKRYLGQSTLLDVPDTGLVCHVHVRRSDGAYAAGAQGPSVSWYPPQPPKGDKARREGEEESWYHSLERLDRLNSDIARQQKEADAAAAHVSHAAFVQVDRLANAKMEDIRKRYNRIFALAALMAIVGNRVPGDGEHWVITSLALSLLLLILLTQALKRVHRSKANRNATDLRALAEGLRVQNVWRQAGIARAVSLHYLRRSHDNIAWVRRAMLGASVYPLSEPAALPQALEKVKEEWVRDQRDYFVKNVERKERKNRLAKRMATGLFGAGIVVTALVLGASLTGLFNEHLAHTLHSWNMWGEHLAELLIASAALSAAWAKFLGYEEDIADYQRSADLFDTALTRMAGTGAYTPDTEDRQETLYALGIETLQENARWVTRTTGRDVEVIGG